MRASLWHRAILATNQSDRTEPAFSSVESLQGCNSIRRFAELGLWVNK